MLNFEPSFFNFIFTFTNRIQKEIKGDSKKNVTSVVFIKTINFLMKLLCMDYLQYFQYCFNFFNTHNW